MSILFNTYINHPKTHHPQHNNSSILLISIDELGHQRTKLDLFLINYAHIFKFHGFRASEIPIFTIQQRRLHYQNNKYTLMAMDLPFDLDEVLNMAGWPHGDINDQQGDIAVSTNSSSFTSPMLLTSMTSENGACSVCMEGFESSSEGGKLVPCGHVYHAACISTWLCISNSCPLCRCKF